MDDIGSVEIAAGLAGSVTIGTLCMLMLQTLKALVPTIQGRAAEIAVLIVSLVAVGLALLATDADWSATETYIGLFVGWLSTAVIARGVFAQLFRPAITSRVVIAEED